MSDLNNQNYNYQPGNTYNVEPEKPVAKNQGLGIASLVLGIVSFFGCCCYGIGGLILGVLAIIFGAVYLNTNKGLLVSKGMAIAGIILGSLAALAGLITFVGVLWIGTTDQDKILDKVYEMYPEYKVEMEKLQENNND